MVEKIFYSVYANGISPMAVSLHNKDKGFCKLSIQLYICGKTHHWVGFLLFKVFHRFVHLCTHLLV